MTRDDRSPRSELLDLLERYLARRPEDLVRVDHLRQFVRQHPDCFERSCVEGHLTGSAWVVSPDLRQTLLVHHRRLDRWLQPGGHADGRTELHEVALAEVREETGLEQLELVSADERQPPLPFDVDVHRIPARPGEPAHLHHDLRYLVVAAPGQPLRVCEEELLDARWFGIEQVASLTREESLLRMARRSMQKK